jgi:acyl-CoA reductase-like NAD-dependent aldehyde dehydrogenase
MGAMISTASFSRLESLIKSAVADGARLIVGGSRYNHPVYKQGSYFQPTLLVDVTASMEIAKEECFGPICVVMRASGPAEAVDIANAPNFGLGASVFGANGYDLNEVARSLKSGMVAVNDFAAYYAVQLPFGGVGGSGYGRFAGEEGLRGLCNIKGICRDRWSWMGISTAIPPGLRYPIPDTRKGRRLVTAIIDLGYQPGLWAKVTALGRLIRNSM